MVTKRIEVNLFTCKFTYIIISISFVLVEEKWAEDALIIIKIEIYQ